MLLFALVFLFQLQRHGSVSKAWVPSSHRGSRVQPTEKLITDTDRANVCVCARVQRKEWCAYLSVHAPVYTLVILDVAWAGEVPKAASHQPSDTRLEVMAVTFSHDLFLEASCLA